MSRLNRSFWLEHATTEYPPLTDGVDVDAAVIRAGITGLTAAHLLKHGGKTVALLEMNRIGCGATGYTTAKLAVPGRSPTRPRRPPGGGSAPVAVGLG